MIDSNMHDIADVKTDLNMTVQMQTGIDTMQVLSFL